MDEFYKGQNVHCKRNGNGYVTAISDEDHPIIVIFDSGHRESYTRNGEILIGTRETHLTPREEEEVMPKDFCVGQKVCCKHKGEGVVIEINEPTRTYPVKVKFHSDGYETYTADGKAFCWRPEPDLTPAQEEPVFTVGQRVWCVLFGEGVVAQSTHGMYPVKVKFKIGDVRTYTREGYMYINCRNQSLFPHPVKIVQDDSATKPSIDWSHVKEDYKWLSVNANGSADVYEYEPKVGGGGYWCNPKGGSNKVNGLASYVPGTCDWRDSLVKRPN